MEAVNEASRLVAQVLDKLKTMSLYDQSEPVMESVEMLENALEKLAKAI